MLPPTQPRRPTPLTVTPHERQERDMAVLQRIRDGDREAVAELCELYRKLIWKLAKALATRHHPKEDLAQEGFFVLLQATDYDPSGPAAFSTWAYEKVRTRMLSVRLCGLVRAASHASDSALSERTARQRTAAQRYPKPLKDRHAVWNAGLEAVDVRDFLEWAWNTLAKLESLTVYSVVAWLHGRASDLAKEFGIAKSTVRKRRMDAIEFLRGLIEESE